MKSFVFAAAVVMGAVAQGALLAREEDCEKPGSPGYKPGHKSQASGYSTAMAGSGSSGSDHKDAKNEDELPCGADSLKTYTVKKDDKLNLISAAFQAGVCDIALASNIQDINVIFPQQTLIIPIGCTTIDNTTCVKTPEVEATASCVAGEPDSYAVVSGDTLGAIAKDFVITLNGLLSANKNIVNPDLINIGQKINIPVCPNSKCDKVEPYKIKSGDVYVNLAATYKTTIGQIKALNPTVDPTKLAIDQQITLPQNCHNATSSM